ncbi:MAG: HNH endonuclease [Acidimicrobiales bacterium]
MARKAEDLATRFERMVDRTGDHHLWLGNTNPKRGTGRFKVDKVDVTAHRVAWELAHGPLPPNARVLSCPGNGLCVRIDHLSLGGEQEQGGSRPQARAHKGTGSMRLIRRGTWELRVTVGRWDDGRPRTLYRSVSARTKADPPVSWSALSTSCTPCSLPTTKTCATRPLTKRSSGS